MIGVTGELAFKDLCTSTFEIQLSIEIPIPRLCAPRLIRALNLPLSDCHLVNFNPNFARWTCLQPLHSYCYLGPNAIGSLMLQLPESAYASSKIANCSESGNVLALKTRPGRDSHRIRSTVYIPECPQRLPTTQASIFLDTALRINVFKLIRVKGTCLFVSGVPAWPVHDAVDWSSDSRQRALIHTDERADLRMCSWSEILCVVLRI